MATEEHLTPVATPEEDSGLWKLDEVLDFVKLGRTRWLIGVRRGDFPAPVRLSTRRVAWRSADIRRFVAGL